MYDHLFGLSIRDRFVSVVKFGFSSMGLNSIGESVENGKELDAEDVGP
jgi:hypothetical protein